MHTAIYQFWVLMVPILKTSIFENIDLALGIVHKESAANYQFIFNCASDTGLNWNSYILFSDVGIVEVEALKP
jgi:hypothetical protein